MQIKVGVTNGNVLSIP